MNPVRRRTLRTLPGERRVESRDELHALVRVWVAEMIAEEHAELAGRQDRLDDRGYVHNVRLSEIEARLPGGMRTPPADAISVKQAAYRSGLSPSSIYAKWRQGKLAGMKVGGRVLIDAGALAAAK
jgi:hypothetical protein